MNKLPDAEFEVMKVVWSNEPPITSHMVMTQLGKEKGWKATTIITLLMRLVERKFLRTEKNGKERSFFPIVNKEDYLQFETNNFVRTYHENSFFSLFSSLYEGKEMSENEIEKMIEWMKGLKK